MAALNRPKKANYEVHESVKVDTMDNEDHTFCGIMFPVKARELLPVDKVLIRSVSVRGQLGPMTVWVSREDAGVQDGDGGDGANRRRHRRRNDNNNNNANRNVREYNFRLSSRHWKKVYEGTHAPSQRDYCELRLAEPIVLRPGQVRAVYVHSKLQGDEAIVYDNSRMLGVNRVERREPRVEDKLIQIMSGKSHLSCVPFGQVPIWGWGNAWRDLREFVGRIEYGCVYRLWNPELHHMMGDRFRSAVEAVLSCQRRTDSPLSVLPDECVYYILNMCHWSWFEDDINTMKQRRTARKRAARQRAELLRNQQQPQQMEEAEARVNADQAGRDGDGDYDASMRDGTEHGEEAEDEAMEVVAGDSAGNGSGGEEDGGEADEDILEEDDGSESDDSDEREWERANGYRADTALFSYQDVSSDEDDDDEGNNRNNNNNERGRGTWFFARAMARAHVLRALARVDGDDEDVDDNDDDDDDDSDYIDS